MGNRQLALYVSAIAAGLSFAAPPAQADTIAEADSMARATTSPSAGMELARRQIQGGDLLEALATLERMLINHPDMPQALLLHATLLCRLDDRSGAIIEFDRLRRRGIPDALWNEAFAPCNTSPSPTRRQGHD